MLPVVLSGKHMASSNGELVPASRAAVNAGMGSSHAWRVDLVESRVFDVREVVSVLIKRHTFPRIVWS